MLNMGCTVVSTVASQQEGSWFESWLEYVPRRDYKNVAIKQYKCSHRGY